MFHRDPRRVIILRSNALSKDGAQNGVHGEVSSGQPPPAPERRKHQRDVLTIPFHLRYPGGGEQRGTTDNLGLGGLGLISVKQLALGTPLTVSFSFGGTCYLNISAQVVFCFRGGDPAQHHHCLTGIKFCRNREIDEKILISAIDTLKQCPGASESSLLEIVVSEDALALEAGRLRPEPAGPPALSQEDPALPTHRTFRLAKEDLIPRKTSQEYTPEATRVRREWLSAKTGADFKHIGMLAESPQSLRGNIENLIGVARIPIGVAGPLKMNGEFAKGTFYVPMATTEGALAYTYSHAMLLISLAGGATASILKDETHITPVFCFPAISDAQRFVVWLRDHREEIQCRADSTTRYGRLRHLEPYLFDRNVAVKFCYTTGDAMGMNMITFATEEACKYIVAAVKPARYYLQSNFSSPKKVSFHNFIQGSGKSVVSEAVIPAGLVQRFYRIAPRDVVDYYRIVCLSTQHAGMVGVSGHTANALAAVYIACGQDTASVADAYVAITNFEVTDEGNLYVSIKLPTLLVGTVGGGTGLNTQRECLSMLGCNGPGFAGKFAEIVAGTALAGELGICARVANGTFAQAHRKYGRKSWPSSANAEKAPG